ncbi:hypothetical protein C9J12_21255 [Photobacterium frigidiphilum]|uniref:Uncharacterized protein n=1 Tax=Photobacterium frigidiphilum TaxID=264736 RepID=A0A2T3JA98_9GAMM|nr:hypothetical protein [Photobacterium frigidiphilum]PSU45770.1 hypothetical protein C9J12_21255 [Photobacterium frigidiphilum]
MSEAISNKKKGITLVVVLAAIVGVGVTLWPSSPPPAMDKAENYVNAFVEHRQVVAPLMPRKVAPVFVSLDADAEIIVSKTRDLSVATLKAEVASQDAKTRQSNQTISGTEDVSQALGLGRSLPQIQAVTTTIQPHRSEKKEEIQGLLSQVQLRSLISIDGKTTAWISLGNNDPIKVHPKMRLASLVIESVSSQGVFVREGDQRQFFPRRFHSMNKAVIAQQEG